MSTFNENSQEDAKFTDILGPVLIAVVSIFIVSLTYAYNLTSQVTDSEDQVRLRQEQVATLQEQLLNTTKANQFDSAELNVPHPETLDRDTQAIGNHINVAWSYPGDASGRYINFEVEVLNVECKSRQKPCAQITRFVTSDATNHSTRIPAGSVNIEAGTYAWRVVPVPAGTVLDQGNIRKPDELNPLSAWSNLGSFTIYPSLLERVMTTGVVRVGTNLEQDTRFSRKLGNGEISGLDISLIYTLVEKCLDTNRNENWIKFNRSKCSKYITSLDDDSLKSHPSDCTPSQTQLCVDLIPIQKWGEWQPALKRKELDLFIGAVTAAKYRENDGIRFTPGYLRYQTRLYAHASDVPGEHLTLKNWLQSRRLVGVIEKSSNEYLLDQLCAEMNAKKKCGDKLDKQPFPSFPKMEHAMDRGEIDGILVDETFVNNENWKHLEEIRGVAWDNYKDKFIQNRDSEMVGIAVAVDDLRPSMENSAGDNLYKALSDALSVTDKSPVIETYLPRLCRAFWDDSNSGDDKFCKSAVIK